MRLYPESTASKDALKVRYSRLLKSAGMEVPRTRTLKKRPVGDKAPKRHSPRAPEQREMSLSKPLDSAVNRGSKRDQEAVRSTENSQVPRMQDSPRNHIVNLSGEASPGPSVIPETRMIELSEIHRKTTDQLESACSRGAMLPPRSQVVDRREEVEDARGIPGSSSELTKPSEVRQRIVGTPDGTTNCNSQSNHVVESTCVESSQTGTPKSNEELLSTTVETPGSSSRGGASPAERDSHVEGSRVPDAEKTTGTQVRKMKRLKVYGPKTLDDALSQERLREEFRTIMSRISGPEGNFQKRQSLRRKVMGSEKLIDEVNEVLELEWRDSDKSLWSLSQMTYAAAELITWKVYEERESRKVDPREETLAKKEAEIRHLRRMIGWITGEIARRQEGKELRPRLSRNLRIISRLVKDPSLQDLKVLNESHLARLRVRSSQVKRIAKAIRARNASRQFALLGPKSLEPLGSRSRSNQIVPTSVEIREFWGGVVGVEGDFDEDDPAVQGWTKSFEEVEPLQWDDGVMALDWVQTLKKAKNWRSPGPDKIQAFWWKALDFSSSWLKTMLSEVLGGRARLPSWFVEGRTVLIPKAGCVGKPSQFRPITCLNTSYKLLTGLLTLGLRRHVDASKALPTEQRALRKGTRGCIDALLVDSLVVEDAKVRGLALSTAWFDYQKAFDRVPHHWLRQMLAAIKAPAEIQRCISTLIPLWRSCFECGRGRTSVQVNLEYKRGLFQGDSLSPLLFCLSIAPLSFALRKETMGYVVRSGNSLTHSFFMDDLKLYARGRKRLVESMKVVERVSGSVGMKLGFEKCAVAHRSKSDMELEPVAAEARYRLAEQQSPYCYLGIHQVFNADCKTLRENLKKTYVKRLRRIWKSRLTGKEKVKAVNMWAVSIFRYYFGILKWTGTTLKDLDLETRRVLKKFKVHHANASLERLYLPRHMGGRGLSSLKLVWEREVVSLVAYVCGSEDPLLRQVLEQWDLLCNRGRVTPLGSARKVLDSYGLDSRNVKEVPSKIILKQLRQQQQVRLEERLSQKLIHGVFFKQCRKEGWDAEGSHGWLVEGRFQGETEALIIAMQDGVIHTRNYLKNVHKLDLNPTCRVCGKMPETIGHLLSNCKQMSWTLYKTRHDRVLYQLVLAYARRYNIKIPDSMRWYTTGWRGVGVLESDEAKLLIDVSMPTDRQLEERRPDLILEIKGSKTILILEVAVAWDPLVIERESQKRGKYSELAKDLAGQFRGWKVKVVPIVLGCLGSLGSFRAELESTKTLGARERVYLQRNCQAEVLCGAVRIVRSTLSQ